MKRFLADWRTYWFVLLLPVALFLPALPIDETRYLAVAWEMRQSGDFLLLHLNGAPYSDKGPLLFWLINLAWLVAGVHVWIVRLGVLAASLASLLLFGRLVHRLEASDSAATTEFATRAAVLLAGMLYFAIFSSAIMFDILLMTCVLIAAHGIVDLDAQRWRRGTLIFALGLGLGILTKGPVILLDAGLLALFGPWWSATARQFKLRWYVALLLAIVGGAALALAWAIPAAVHGGPDYANAIFVRQTMGRVAKSFAHSRPSWWYFGVLPLMMLPWTVSLRAPWRAWRNGLTASKSARVGVAWFLPAFVAFCFVSGKQPHYLLPLLPGMALYLAHVLNDAEARVRGRLFGTVLALAGFALFVLPFFAGHAAELPWSGELVRKGNLTPNALAVVAGLWPWWGVLVGVIGLGVLVHPRLHARLLGLALAAVAASTLGMLSLAQSLGPTVDVNLTAAAARIRAVQESGRPIVHLAWHHGLFEFAGRLTRPLPSVDFGHLYEWCAAHPDGEVVSIYTKYPIAAKPEGEIPYRLGRVLFWRAADLCAAPHAAPSMKPDDDDSSDD